MGHIQKYIGHTVNQNGKQSQISDLVLEKGIFSNVFEKDIRRVFIYKKAERIAKALNLIAPAFTENVSLKERVDTLALKLIDVTTHSPKEVRAELPREILTLSSILSIAKMGGILSAMNAEIILREARELLEEMANYEDTTLILEEVPSVSTIAKNTLMKDTGTTYKHVQKPVTTSKGHLKDIVEQEVANKDRKSLIVSVISSKGNASIKDISTVVRGVSEKTIQREILALIESGVVSKTGERRWSTYALA
jgi:hypothetical protein